MPYRVELDTCEPFNHPLLKFVIEHGIRVEVVEWEGPAGGNPLIAFEADYRDTLCDMINRFWGNSQAVMSFGDASQNREHLKFLQTHIKQIPN